MIKWPGSGHDARMLPNSGLNEMLKTETIPPLYTTLVPDSVPVPVCILGDPAYPLLPRRMKEFPGGGTTCTAKEQFFGYLQEWLLNARREVDINMDERPIRYMPASFYTIFVKQRLCLEAWHINMSNHV